MFKHTLGANNGRDEEGIDISAPTLINDNRGELLFFWVGWHRCIDDVCDERLFVANDKWLMRARGDNRARAS